MALLPLARLLIRIHELKGTEGLVVSVPVKVIVCATSGVAHYHRMTGVPPQTQKSDEQVSADPMVCFGHNIPAHCTCAECLASPSPPLGLVIGVSL